MDQKELVRISIAAGMGFIAGQVWEQFKITKKRRNALKKFNMRETNDFWKTISNYLNDPSDNRTVEQMIDDWQTNLKFHKIVNNEE